MDIQLCNEIDISQKLVITPQMQQSMEVLHMGQQELIRFIEQQAMENPVIEVEPVYDELEVDEKFKRRLEWLEENDRDDKVFYRTEEESFESDIAAEDVKGLTECLIEQLGYLDIDGQEYQIAERIIHCLDPNGYLEVGTGEISKMLNVSAERVENVLKVIQSLEPYGVGARDLKECLAIQLAQKGMTDQRIFDLVRYHLEDLGRNKLQVIAKKLGIPLDRVKEMQSVIKALSPRPGSSYGWKPPPRCIKPDVVVAKFKDHFEVMLNDFSCPKIGINHHCASLLRESPEEETKKYIANKINQACWIIKAIDQRNSTLRNVSRVIVDIQQQFFTRGPKYLIPMILKDVAGSLSMHESTVSRAIHDKYLQCSWGIFKLKFFFSIGLGGSEESGSTPEGIKRAMKEILDAEDKAHPYSDQKIADSLRKKGIEIARRTVAKYREELNVPAASLRKVF